jgi:hypothetical protein
VIRVFLNCFVISDLRNTLNGNVYRDLFCYENLIKSSSGISESWKNWRSSLGSTGPVLLEGVRYGIEKTGNFSDSLL